MRLLPLVSWPSSRWRWSPSWWPGQSPPGPPSLGRTASPTQDRPSSTCPHPHLHQRLHQRPLPLPLPLPHPLARPLARSPSPPPPRPRRQPLPSFPTPAGAPRTACPARPSDLRQPHYGRELPDSAPIRQAHARATLPKANPRPETLRGLRALHAKHHPHLRDTPIAGSEAEDVQPTSAIGLRRGLHSTTPIL